MSRSPAEKTLADLINDAHEFVSQIETFLEAHGAVKVGDAKELFEIPPLLNALYDRAIWRVAAHTHDAVRCQWCKWRATEHLRDIGGA